VPGPDFIEAYKGFPVFLALINLLINRCIR
jgi:hypothetical protein